MANIVCTSLQETNQKSLSRVTLESIAFVVWIIEHYDGWGRHDESASAMAMAPML